MALTPGTRLGPFEITSQLGTGGMGEVYRAIDANLKRAVAIKVLPESLASDPQRMARFQREAEILAALNHPHIAAIYGLERAHDLTALVMELIDGPTLGARIAKGPIQLGEALDIAKQIADATEAAHARGIIHRDLKPANIKVRSDGVVKVLDFGLAKTVEPASASSTLTQSPTMTSPAMTAPGVLLGTTGYMSPEQAQGRQVDTRTDIWAFGVVLYETLAGRPAFAGDTTTEILAAVLKSEPDWSSLPDGTPATIQSLIRRCLAKDPARRLRDIADARLEIEDALASPPSTLRSPVSRRRERLWWSAALAAAAVVMVILANTIGRLATPADAPEMRLGIPVPAGTGDFSLSPDGRKLVISSANQLWLRFLDQEAAQPLPGTEGGGSLFWSPDSQSIAFVSAGSLKRIDIGAGLVQALAPAFGNAGAWSKDGTILFSRSSGGPLYRMPATGGEITEATRVELPQHGAHRFPHFLPDGRHFVYFALGTSERRGVYLGVLDSMESRRLFDADSVAAFAPPDYLLFARGGALVAQRLDLDTLQMAGDPFPIAPRVDAGFSYYELQVSTSAAGPIAYRASRGTRQLIWLNRLGEQIGTVGEPDSAKPDFIRLSPNGKRIVVTRRVDGNQDVWIGEAPRGILQRLTFHSAPDTEAVWSPEGDRIAFASLRNGLPDLYAAPASETAQGEIVLFSSAEFKNLLDWSRDGRFLLFSSQSQSAGRDLWALPVAGGEPLPVARTPSEEWYGRFSPDTRWVAYQSNETGQFEVYVQPFPRSGSKVRVSNGGGTTPVWRADARELFYRDPSGYMMAAILRLDGDTADVDTPVRLFRLPRNAGWDVAPDGERFLVNSTDEESSVTLLLNWKAGKR